MKTIGLICKRQHPELPAILGKLVPWLTGQGIEVYMDAPAFQVPGLTECLLEEIPSKVEMVIVLGGDGTMLGAARLVSPKGIPLLGVNLGGLGFITEVHKDELYGAVERILNGECSSEKRIMLSASLIRQGRELGQYLALNDIVINKGPLPKLIDLQTSVDGMHVSTFKADGIIISTPTGSTAYSMSAGGPILYPTLHSITITPICPHMLTNRPIALPDNVRIEVALRSESDDVILSHDSIVACSLKKDDVVVVEKSAHCTTLLMPCDRDHFQVLRTKLKWGER